MKSVSPSVLTVNGGSSSIRFAIYEVGETPRRRLAGNIELHKERNSKSEGAISKDALQGTVRVIHTDEELMIARSVCRSFQLGGASS